tara:strand:- start:221 stop:562 length:342 start_codon:yes stop_codon:yes gene_type:complete
MSDKNELNGNMNAGVDGGNRINNLNDVINTIIDFHSQLVGESWLGHEVLEEVVADLKRIRRRNGGTWLDLRTLKAQVDEVKSQPIRCNGCYGLGGIMTRPEVMKWFETHGMGE